MRFRHRRSEEVEEGESYYVSMTDMMVGVLFIFIIMLSYFALEFRQSTVAVRASQRTEEATAAGKSNGTGDVVMPGFDMQYPLDQLFVAGTADLTPKGEALAASVGNTILLRLDCQPRTDRDPNCAGMKRVRRVVVGMSTRYDPDSADGRRDASLLPARSNAFHAAVIAAVPQLGTAVNLIGNKILVASEASQSEPGKPNVSRMTVHFFAYIGGGAAKP